MHEFPRGVKLFTKALEQLEYIRSLSAIARLSAQSGYFPSNLTIFRTILYSENVIKITAKINSKAIATEQLAITLKLKF